MSDLDLDVAHTFWSQYHDASVYRILMFMEGVETWTYDGDPEFEKAVRAIDQALDASANATLREGEFESDFIHLITHLKMSRCLRALQKIDSLHPGTAAKLLHFSETQSTSSSDVLALLLRRNVALERFRILSRIFHKDRIALVQKTMEGVS